MFPLEAYFRWHSGYFCPFDLNLTVYITYVFYFIMYIVFILYTERKTTHIEKDQEWQFKTLMGYYFQPCWVLILKNLVFIKGPILEITFLCEFWKYDKSWLLIIYLKSDYFSVVHIACNSQMCQMAIVKLFHNNL